MEEGLNVSESQEGKAFFEAAQMVNGLVLFPIICILGITGNLITIAVLSRKEMRTTTNVYLRALAVSDAFKLLTDMLYPVVITVQHYNYDAGNKAFAYMYPYAHFVFQMSACVSAWLIMSVAIERYIMVCHPTRAKQLCTMARSKLVLAIVFITSTILAIPTALRYKTVLKFNADRNSTELGINVTSLWQNQQFSTGYTWVQIIVRSMIPLLSLLFLNALIISALRVTRANRRNARRNKITVMLVAVILLFLFCNIPDAVMSTVLRLGYHESDFMAKGVRECTDSLLALNAALNFVIYCAFSKQFRDQFPSKCCRKAEREEDDEGQPNPDNVDPEIEKLNGAKNGVTCQGTETAQLLPSILPCVAKPDTDESAV